MKRIWLFLMTIALTAGISLWGSDTTTQEKEIRSMIERQNQEWNRGNFEGFMAPYWHSEAMTFQSGNTRRYGWQTLLDMYKKNYAGDKRGTLYFTDLEINFLGEDTAYVLGRWRVVTGSGVESAEKVGLFTLILRRFPSGWRIIHDHSS